jgi:RNase H-like domain found in reverse transcriptase
LHESKCAIGISSEGIVVLGHTIINGKIGVDDTKIEAIKKLKFPTNKKELRMALGLLGYYQKMVKNYAEISSGLTECLKKEKPDKIIWAEKLQQAFEELKRALMSKPLLSPPDFSKGFILQTDSSAHSIAGILSQLDDAGNERVICYTSRKMLPNETRYSTIQQELLAVVNATKVFQNWIYGRKVLLQSDHRPLAYLDSMANSNSRLTRWSLWLDQFNLEYSFKRGVDNYNVDALTRLPT